MDKCKYYLNVDGVTKTFNSDRELSDFVKTYTFKDNDGKLKVKYSKVDSGLQTPQEQIIEKIKSGIDSYSANYITRSDFLSRSFSIDGNDPELLSPVFINKNYIDMAVNNLLETDPNLISLVKDGKKVEAAQIAREEIQNELILDERMKRLSIAVSNLMRDIVNKEYALKDEEIDKIFKLVAEYNVHDEIEALKKEGISSSEYNKRKDEIVKNYIEKNINNDMRNNFRNQINLWYKNISTSSNEFIGNIRLSKATTLENANGLNSWIPYASISPSGEVDIYEVAVTRNRYEDWHSAKKITTDFKLGVNRQLLENIVPTYSSSLYVQPVIFPTKDGKILLSEFYIDSVIDRSRSDSGSRFDENGEYTHKLRKILPSRTRVDFEESSRLDSDNKEILGIMFGKYNFRTKLMINDYERKYNDIVKAAKDEPVLYLYDALNQKRLEEKNTPEGRERFKEVVKDYVLRANKQENSQMIDLVKAIKSAKNESGDKILKEIKFGRSSIELQRMFNKYLSDEWEIVTDRPELLNGGLIVFKNVANLTVEVVSITVNQLRQTNDLSVGNTILGKFKKNEFLKHDDKILKATSSNIETMKALTILNSNPDLIKGYSLNGIKVFNALENEGDFIDIERALYNFDKLLTEVNKYKPVKNNFKGRKAEIKVTNFNKVLYNEIMNIVVNVDNKKMKAFIGQMDNIDELTDNKSKLDWFLKLREEIISQNSAKLSNLDATKIDDFSNPINYLYYLVSAGVAYYSGIDSVFDYENPQLGISVADATHWLRTLVYGSAPEYDKNGNKVVGLFQGQHFNTTDALQSVYMTKMHDLITIAQNKIVSDFNKKKNIIINATNQYYKEIGRSGLEKFLIGLSDQYHEVFFETHNGKITRDFKLKNPWDNKSLLSTAERKYLKQIIYCQYINGKYGNLDLDTLDKFEKSSEFSKMMADGSIEKLLKVPLIKKQSLSRMKSLTTDGFRKFIGQTWDSMKNALDPRDMTGDENEDLQKVGAYNSVNAMNKMYNQFDAQESEEYRDKLIEKYGTGFFEVNLDTIALKYAFENTREGYFNEVLPILQSGVTMMKFYGWQTGKTSETEKALEDFFDQLKISVFNISIVKNKEIGEALGIVKSIQKVTSLMTLALRPPLLIKELVFGFIKNASYGWSKIYGDDSFTSSDLAKAYGLLIKSQQDFNIISNLNTEYRVANRDLNQIVNKVKVDRTGINFMSNLMYWCNTAPDYVNRLSLFLAKMIKDGCYEAHSIDENGNLVYDPSKDKRYSHYFKMRDQYKYEFSKTDTEYNDQRTLYLKAIEEFNAEIISSSERVLTEKDNIPRAYFSKQRDSIKTFSDTAYGYYDTERSPLIKHTAVGIIFGQFMTFWPSFVKYYFSPERKSKRGYMNHKHTFDADGNKIYYYVKFTTDPETGETFREEVPESELAPDDPRAKAWEWVGEPCEGLMYSLGLTIRSIFTGDFDKLDPQRLKNAKVGLHDLMVALIALFLANLLMSDKKKSKSDSTKLSQYEKLSLKIFQKATGEFDPFTNLLGPFQSTPSFLQKVGEIKDGIKSLSEGKSDFATFIRNNINAAELIPNPATRN